jgi:hypothetical protein
MVFSILQSPSESGEEPEPDDIVVDESADFEDCLSLDNASIDVNPRAEWLRRRSSSASVGGGGGGGRSHTIQANGKVIDGNMGGQGQSDHRDKKGGMKKRRSRTKGESDGGQEEVNLGQTFTKAGLAVLRDGMVAAAQRAHAEVAGNGKKVSQTAIRPQVTFGILLIQNTVHRNRFAVKLVTSPDKQLYYLQKLQHSHQLSGPGKTL